MATKSHLLQMRGLKQWAFLPNWSDDLVASFTDAWIETSSERAFIRAVGVASFTDAWIETVLCDTGRRQNIVSHLLQMRGLKPNGCAFQNKGYCRIFYRCVD